MPKVIGIGETIYDIIFENNRPIDGKAGGSVFNALISLARLQQETVFISEIGDDKVGNLILDFLKENKVDTEYVACFQGTKTPLSLAFLDENRNAHYSFYKDYAAQQAPLKMPPIAANDIVLFGSFFALNTAVRQQVIHLLDTATKEQAIVYYDVNFRKTHISKRHELIPALIENMQYADIVKGSDEDFEHIYNEKDPLVIYQKYIAPHCSTFIYTQGANGAMVFTPTCSLHVPSITIVPLSTIGAGDTFNAGIVFALLQKDIGKNTLGNIHEQEWKNILQQAIDCATHVCMLYDNYITIDFAQNKKQSLS
jgi:fructokinase